MIKIEKLSKTYNYGKSNAVKALNGITMEIADGELVAITGRSGAGKSTLMHIIACVDGFEDGEYFLDEIQLSKCSENRKASIRNMYIGTVFQDFSLIDGFSVLENVEIPLFFSPKCSAARRRKLALAALDKVGVKSLAERNVTKLSGGQKQRVAIARAIVNNPSVILADEPTGALDTKTGEEIFSLFKDLNSDGKTVIIITHDRDIAESCARHIKLEDGQVVEER